MKPTQRLSDEAIRSALTLDPSVRAPLDLGGGIRTLIDSTPQQRRPWFRATSPRMALAVRLVVVGLLTLALIGAVLLIGSQRHPPSLLPAVNTYHGGPDRTGVMAGPGPQGTLTDCWPPATLAGPVGSYAPVVADGIVYIGDASGSLTAVNEESGSVLWQSPVGSTINDAPAIAGNLVVVGSDDGFLTARDAHTGGFRWRFQTGGPVRSSPAAVDGVLYFGSNDGRLYALDATSGSAIWSSADTGGQIDRAVAIAGGVIYAGSGNATDATFDAFDSRTGRPIWSQPVHLGPGQTSTPAYADGRVYVASGLDSAAGTHLLYAIDATTGLTAWHWSSPKGAVQQVNIGALANGVVYVVSYDHAVYALDAATGASRWAAPFETKGPIGAVAGLVDGTLYVPSSDRRIYSIDATTGRQRWDPVAVPGDPSAPAIVDGRLFVATTTGKLACIKGSTAASP